MVRSELILLRPPPTMEPLTKRENGPAFTLFEKQTQKHVAVLKNRKSGNQTSISKFTKLPQNYLPTSLQYNLLAND